MHTPPRIALLAALGLIALLPSLPLGRGVNAGEHDPQDIYSLELIAVGPIASQGLPLDIALVPPGASWPGPLAAHRPGQPLLLSQLPVPYDVLMRSTDGLWAARETLFTMHLEDPLEMHLEPRGVLSGFVYNGQDSPASEVLITARNANGQLFTQLTETDGSFRFSWLPESKYTISTPASIHGACHAETICISGKDIRLNLTPNPTKGEAAEVIGKVHSNSGSYQEDLRVKLWPLDLESAPQDTSVVWSESSEGVISGEFNVPATVGERYVLSLVKSDMLPASFTQTPIEAPSEGLDIFFDDTRPHTKVTFQPADQDSSDHLTAFEIAISWGQGVTWRSTETSQCSLEGVPCNTPISWHINAPGKAPAYGEALFTDTKAERVIAPRLTTGWGEGLKVIHPDGTPAPGILVLLDGEEAGHTSDTGNLTLQAKIKPQTLSLSADNHRLFGGSNSVRTLDSLIDRDELGRLLLVLLPRD
jgi:hypothetical protein